MSEIGLTDRSWDALELMRLRSRHRATDHGPRSKSLARVSLAPATADHPSRVTRRMPAHSHLGRNRNRIERIKSYAPRIAA